MQIQFRNFAGSGLDATRSARQLGERVGFRLHLMGHSQAPITPHRVGAWWMEPLRDYEALPPRARYRLESLLSSGLQPKAVVLFHELPQFMEQEDFGISTLVNKTDRLRYQIPETVEAFSANVAKKLPVVGALLWRVGLVVLPLVVLSLGVLVAGAATAATAVGTAVALDPCLVVVTVDGYWIEVDRWDE